MLRVALFMVVVLLLACGGHIQPSNATMTTRAPDDAYACVVEQLGKMEYHRLQYDTGEHWYIAQKVDPTGHISDVRFRQRLNRIEVRIHPDASGNTSLELKPQTFDQYSSQRGVVDELVKTSDQVKADAARLAQACSQ
jgi:hypothetical protein